MSTSSADWHAPCKKILQAFMKDPQCEPFLEPVPWKELNLFDYPKVIKKPCDLGKIEKNFKKYKSPVEFANEFRLIWSNCMLYNVEGSDFYALADKLSKQFEKKFKVVPNAGDAGVAVRQPTFKEKMDFGEKVYRVTPQQLGRVVQILDEKCPDCIDKSVSDELAISIDEIPADVFHDLYKYLLSVIPETSKKNSSTSSSSGPSSKKQRVG
jgi:hypothetical protein